MKVETIEVPAVFAFGTGGAWGPILDATVRAAPETGSPP